MKRSTKTPVGAHYGLGDWLMQRLTAVVMAGYTIFVLVMFLMRPPATHAAWRALFEQTWFEIGTMIFVAALVYHAWVGMRDILMDYLRATSLRLLAECAVGFLLFFYLVWAAVILWGR